MVRREGLELDRSNRQARGVREPASRRAWSASRPPALRLGEISSCGAHQPPPPPKSYGTHRRTSVTRRAEKRHTERHTVEVASQTASARSGASHGRHTENRKAPTPRRGGAGANCASRRPALTLDSWRDGRRRRVRARYAGVRGDSRTAGGADQLLGWAGAGAGVRADQRAGRSAAAASRDAGGAPTAVAPPGAA